MSPTIKTLTFLSIIFLTSCVFLTENRLEQTISDNNFLNRFPQNQKAIIIFKLSGKRGDKIYFCQQKNISASDIKSCQQIYVSNQYKILMLKPDRYYLFSTPQNHPIFSQNKIAEQLKYLNILEAKSGEIEYVGDINYKQSVLRERGYEEDEEITVLNHQFSVIDNFELVKNLLNGKNPKQTQKLFANQVWEINYLIKQYPHLQDRFKKKLLKNFESKPQK